MSSWEDASLLVHGTSRGKKLLIIVVYLLVLDEWTTINFECCWGICLFG